MTKVMHCSLCNGVGHNKRTCGALNNVQPVTPRYPLRSLTPGPSPLSVDRDMPPVGQAPGDEHLYPQEYAAYQAYLHRTLPRPYWDPMSENTQVAAYEAMGDVTTSDAQGMVEAAKMSVARLEAEARENARRSAESWERSDTDGSLSQWANDSMNELRRMQADVARRGNTWEFPVLVDSEGRLVPARLITVHNRFNFGRPESKWAVFANAEDAAAEYGDIIAWVGLGDRAIANRGYRRASQVRVARAVNRGDDMVSVHPVVLPNDGKRFNPDAPLILEA